MYINIFLKEIFNKRIVTEYIIFLLLWLGILLSCDTSTITITNNSFNILAILITFLMTYYMTSGLLDFHRSRDYISLPISSRDFLLNLGWATSIWLFATKYSYLIILYLLVGNSFYGLLYMLAISFVTMHISLWLIVNFRKWKLAIMYICSVLLLILIEIKIESPNLKLAIYLLIVSAIVYSYKKVKLNEISITKLNMKIPNLTINNYFLDAFISEQILLINSGINIFVAVIFATSAPAYYIVLIPVPYAVLALNSGVSTMMSSELATREVLSELPPNSMYLQYICFVYVYFLITNGLLTIIMLIINPTYILVSVLFLVILPVVESLVIVIMELKFPIKAWKVKPDLWRSYRKYIPPTIVLVFCMLIIGIIYL